jgi:hypothetical protein
MRASLALLACLLAAGCATKPAEPSPEALAKAADKLWFKNDLEQALKGKSASEVKALLGTPTSSGGDPESDPKAMFYYRERVMNSSGKPNGVNIFFENKKVNSIIFLSY